MVRSFEGSQYTVRNKMENLINPFKDVRVIQNDRRILFPQNKLK